MIHLHYWPTPNGKKVTILLEELGMPYTIVPVHIGRGDQFKDEFLKISPNNRMPAIVDDEPGDGGAPVSVFESGAIMMYLAEKAGRFYPSALRKRVEVDQWVMWQMANQGPKFGECGHFRRLGDREGDQSYAVRRFTDEVNRLYGVLNNRLFDRRYIAGDEYTIADMISYPWTVNWQGQGQDILSSSTSSAGSTSSQRVPPCSAASPSAPVPRRTRTACPRRRRSGGESCSTTSAPAPPGTAGSSGDDHGPSLDSRSRPRHRGRRTRAARS